MKYNMLPQKRMQKLSCVCVSIIKKPQPTLREVYGMSLVCFIWLSLGENRCALELIRYFSSKLLADLVEFDFLETM